MIHVRVPRRLKERLEELGVNISEEVRTLLEKRLHQLEMERLLEELRESLASEEPVSDSTPLIREDRENR